jgi:hypothetical protein
MRNKVADTTLKWRFICYVLGQIISGAARRTLNNRTLTNSDGQNIRCLQPEIDRFLELLEHEVEALRPNAALEELPSLGNRLMVELAVYTVACDRVLRREGVAPTSAREGVADLGWDLYRRMLSVVSLPVRLVTRDPGRRLRWTIQMLLRFPFNAPGAPGYAVDSWKEGDDILTHFTHCPPQSYVRRLSEGARDPDALEAFRMSWCLYDWPGADIIAGDGRRGHYRRRQTLSHGDPVCDMCWMARAPGVARHGFGSKVSRDDYETS